MDHLIAQLLVRELITETDHLSREWYEADRQIGSARLEALRTAFQRIERSLGSGVFSPTAVSGEIDVVYQRLRDLASGVADTPGREAIGRLMEHASRLRERGPELYGSTARRPTVRLPEASAPLPLDPPDAPWTAALGVTAAAALAVPLLFRALRRSPAAWSISAGIALTALGVSALPKMTREKIVLAGRIALASFPGSRARFIRV